MGVNTVSKMAAKDATFVADLSAALAGDDAAQRRVFDWLYRHAQPAVNNYIRCKFGYTANSANDIQQQAFETLWRGLQEGRAKPGMLTPEFFMWIFGIVWDHAMHGFQKGNRRADIDKKVLPKRAEDLVDAAPGAPTQAIKNEKAAKVRGAIASLDREKQEIADAYLKFGPQWNLIGEAVGKTPDAARMMWKQAIEPALVNLLKTAMMDRAALEKSAAEQTKPATWADVEAAAKAAALNRRHLDILRLRLCDGMTNESVASKLGLEVDVVDQLYTVARASLKPHMNGRVLPRGRIQP